VLVGHGADPDQPDAGGETPLLCCIMRATEADRKCGSLEKKAYQAMVLKCVLILLDYGADTRKRVRRGVTALEESATYFGKGVNFFANAIQAESALRLLEAKLGDAMSPEQVTAARKGLGQAESSAATIGDPSAHRRLITHFSAYISAAEALEEGPITELLEFPPLGSAFMPPAENEGVEGLKKALAHSDSYLKDYGALPDGLGSIVFGKLLARHAEVYKAYLKRYKPEAAQKSLVRFVQQKKGTYLKGYDWAFSQLIEKKEADGLKAVVALESKFPKGTGDSKPKQTSVTLQEVMEHAALMQRRLLLLSERAALHAGKGATHLVVHRKHARETPSLKRIFRSHEKVCLGTPPDELLDVCRAGVECPNMEGVRQVLKFLLDEAAAGDIILSRCKMRFKEPSSGGWRDALVNFHFTDDPAEHVCELQVMHSKMMTIRADMGAHHDYAVFRGAVEVLEYFGVDWEAEDGDDDEEPSHKQMAAMKQAMHEGDNELREELQAVREEVKKRDDKIAELEKRLAAKNLQALNDSSSAKKRDTQPSLSRSKSCVLQ